ALGKPDREAGDAAIERDTTYGVVRRDLSVCYECTEILRAKRRTNSDGHLTLDRCFQGTRVEDLGARACQLEHFLITDARMLLSACYEARIGGEDGLNIGVYVTALGAQSGCQRHCSRVGATPPKGSYVAIG